MCSNSHGSDAIVPSLLFCDEASDNVQFDDDIVEEVMTTSTSNPSLMKRFFSFTKTQSALWHHTELCYDFAHHVLILLQRLCYGKKMRHDKSR